MDGAFIEKQQPLDPYVQQDIRNILKQQQQGIQALILLMKEDFNDLDIMAEELKKDKPK